MNQCVLSQVCEINPPRVIPLPENTPISFVPMGSVSTDGHVDLGQTIERKRAGNYTVFKDGDIIFAKITPCMENGKMAIVDGLMNGYGAGSTEFIVLRPDTDTVTVKWLYHFLSQTPFRLQCQQHMTGSAGQKRVPPKYLASCSIPVPPLQEQTRIVAKIEELFSELDNGVETLEKTKQQLGVYRQAVLKAAFEGIEKFVELSDLTERVFDGPFGTHLKTADYVGKGIRVVRLENIKKARFDDSKQSFVTEQKYETIKAHTVIPSDLIMSTFIADSIKVCQLPSHIPFAVNKADCIGIRLKNGVSQKFVLFYLSSRGAYEKLSHKVHGATRPRVNTTQIKAIEIPMVAYKQQLFIVSEIESRLSVCDNIEKTVDAALQQAEALRQGILKKAFEGRL